MDEGVAQLEGIALHRRDGSQLLSDARSPRRGAARRRASGAPSSRGPPPPPRGQPHRAEAHVRLAGDELLKAAHRRRRPPVAHVAGSPCESALGSIGLDLLQQELRIGQDRGERVVEVVGEPAHRLAEGAQVHRADRFRRAQSSRRRAQIAGPGAEGEGGSGPAPPWSARGWRAMSRDLPRGRRREADRSAAGAQGAPPRPTRARPYAGLPRACRG